MEKFFKDDIFYKYIHQYSGMCKTKWYVPYAAHHKRTLTPYHSMMLFSACHRCVPAWPEAITLSTMQNS